MAKSRIKTHHFIRHSVVITLILTAAVIVPVAYLASQARRDISVQYIDNATSQAVDEFQSMTGVIQTTLELVGDWGVSGLIDLSDTDAINNLFFPLIERETILYGISIADMDGTSYYLRRENKSLRTSITNTTTSPGKSTIQLWDSARKQKSKEVKPSEYDPRNRPWFGPALSDDTVFWTEPYKFYTSDSVGITASFSYAKKEKKGKQIVVAFDILLDELYLELHKLAPSKNSKIFIFRSDAKLYVPKSAESAPDFLSFDSVQNQIITKAHSIWSGKNASADNVITLRHESKNWWCGFQPLVSNRRDTWISVMVPEDDITADINQRRINIWLIGLIAILCCGGLTIWMVYRHGRPAASSSNLFDQNNSIDTVLQIIAAGESRSVEFKSTMRMNLHTGKNGKEIEIAWLKGVAAFLNTDGGALLIGVTDSGEITGLGPDAFENEDRCQLHFKNLVASHIGAELSKYIRFDIVHIDDKQVGVIRCERSTEPAFLKHPKGESFFIRNGPSSDELPVSKVVDYIKHRN